MRLVWRTLAAAVTAGIIASGCARIPVGGHCNASSGSACLESLLAPAERGTVEIVAPKDVSAQSSPTLRYYALGPQECQCMAATNSTLGSALYSERNSVTSNSGRHRRERGDALRRQALTAAAGEAQNMSSSAAMQLYYSLAEGEAKRDVLSRSRGELDGVLAKIAKVRAQGLPLPFDASEFERRKVEVAS
ncbi:MAG TPA: hypothetical protein VHV77_05390, partial [Pirellulales bacterium]|nr:hypothetical protein [Pirellulales bacterium]